MALKAKVASLDDVPASVREFYTEGEGGFVLAVEGAVPRDKLDEFRNNNVTLRREMEQLRAQFDGIDPERARELIARAEKDRDRRLIDAGKVDELLAERTAAMKAGFEKEQQALADRLAAADKRLGELVIDGAIRDAAAKAGVRASAIEDVLLRGQRLFKLVDGKAVPMDGDKVVYGKGGDPLDVAEWVSGLTDQAPHLFEQSRGGGAPQTQNNNVAGGAGGRIARTDHGAFLANLEKVASGQISVS